jgi:tetratricopeptide (TPR) repeat protein
LTFQDALDSGEATGKVIVFQSGDYSITLPQLNVDMDMATRQGSSTILKQNDAPNPSPPINIEVSQSVEVRKAIGAVKEYDRIGDKVKAVESLQEAERIAEGIEKTIIQLELAQRYRYDENYEMAIKYYRLVEQSAAKRELKDKVIKRIQDVEKIMKKQNDTR